MNSKKYTYKDFESCIKCTACTDYCPVLAANPAFPGPKHAGPDQERQRLKGIGFYDEALKLCLNCKRCELGCPSDIPIGDIIQRARISYENPPFNVRNFILSNTDLVGTMSTLAAPLVNPVMKMKLTKSALDMFLNIDKHRQFPKYASQTFEKWFGKQKQQQAHFTKKVAYFHGCYVNYNNPQLGKDMVTILNALNIGVELLEKEKCCGVALISNGFTKQAKKHANINLSSISKAIAGGVDKIVTTSSTCTLTIRDEYDHLLGKDNSSIRDHVELATRYIYRLLSDKHTLNGLISNNKKLRVGYHIPCHMEKLGWSYYSIELMRMIPNIELTVLDSQCCGIAGTYGFKKENYETSQAIGAELFKQIEVGKFDVIASDCETCKWQIEMSTNAKCDHPLTIIAGLLRKKN